MMSPAVCFFPPEQPVLALEAGGIAGQAAVGADDAVAGYDERNGVVAHGAADCLGGHPAAAAVSGQPGGNRPIAHRGAIGDLAQDRPDSLTERRSLRGQRRHEVGHLPVEIAFEPSTGLFKYRKPMHRRIHAGRNGSVSLTLEPKRGERFPVARHPHPAQWRIVMPE